MIASYCYRDKPSAEQVIISFYQDYFHTRNLSKAPLSADLSQLIDQNERLCQKYGGDEVCGKGLLGEMFLNAQEYSPDLNMLNSKFKSETLKDNTIKVTFNVYPELNDSYYDREIHFLIQPTNDSWVVDDLIYVYKNGTSSVRSNVIEDIKELKKNISH